MLSVTLMSIWTASSAQIVKSIPTDRVIQTHRLLQNFYGKYLNADGIIIRSAHVVDDRALVIASGKLRMLLARMPNAKYNLVKSKVELHIIGKDQNTSDLPEYHDQKGVTYLDNGIETDIDKRTRGMGGIGTASCGEENLLRLPQDRYAGGSDICIHEFAHTIMSTGFDDAVRAKIEAQYHKSINRGLWKNAYAATNAGEYWAELTMWYFGFHGDYAINGIMKKNPADGPDGLKAYDSGGYSLLDSIYTGRIQPKLINRKPSMVVSAGIASVYSAKKAKLIVINNQSHNIRLYWVDYKAKPVFKKIVVAKSNVTIATRQSSVWLVEYDKDKSVYMQVNEDLFKLEFK